MRFDVDGQQRWRNPNPLVHQTYENDSCFHAFRGLQQIIRNLENATPEGVTDIQLVNLVAAPFDLRLSLELNRGR